MTRLAISLFGMPRLVRGGGGEVTVPGGCWPIIAFLLARPGHCASRSSLAGALWPEQPEEAARHCLATLLWRFKAALKKGPSPLAAAGDQVSLRLDRGVWIDCHAFERRVRPIVEQPRARIGEAERRRLRRAVSIYRADFLANEQEEWIAVERERLRCIYLDALYALAGAEAETGDWPAAVRAARRLCTAEPLREDAQRLLMIALVASGNRALALKQYGRLVKLLEVELAVEPMPETEALARQIARSGARPTGPRPVSPAVREALAASRDAVGKALRILDRAVESSGGDASVIGA
jgi:DNA-binding SARP family transcriptional activator